MSAPLPADEPAPGPEAPLIASRYRVLGALGEGGMGCVYRVRDEQDCRVVALKRLASNFQDEADRLRFRREFHTLAQLKHPGVVEVFDYGLDDEGPFYTMELLEGQDLHELGVLSPERACRVLRELAETLAFLHARKLLHRDLAARNIRFDAVGRPRLIDFGILATVGTPGDGAGTPPYLAPESLRGLPLDPRTDLYGLGALAYRVLTGYHAYPAKHFQELEVLWSRPVAPPSRLRSDVPPALDALVMSLLSMEPLSRLRSAGDVMEALDAILGETPRAPRESAEAHLASAVLVGRKSELGLLRSALESSLAGQGGALILEGPLGIGKSRLLRELGLEAQLSGAVLLEARAGEELGRGPYAALRELLRRLFAVAAADALEASASLRAELACWSDLAVWLGVPAATPTPDPAEARLRLHSAMAAWLQEVSCRRPLVILLDDIQACDEASLGLIVRLAKGVSRHRVLIALCRTSDQPVRARAAVSALRRQAVLVRLDGLQEADVAELVQATFGRVPEVLRLARWMHQVAGGSPLHTVEVMRHLVSRGVLRYVGGQWLVADDLLEKEPPRALLEQIEAGLAELPPALREIAETFSIHDGELPLELCLKLAGGQEEATVFLALDELVRREVLVGGQTYRFRHAALRDALRQGLSPERRRALHLAVGRALQALGQAKDREAEVGWHLLRGGEEGEGARLLKRAGRRLFLATSYRDALEPLLAALDVYERVGTTPAGLTKLRYMLLVCSSVVDGELAVRHAGPATWALFRCAGLPRAERLRPRLGRRLAFALGLAGALLRWSFAPPSRRDLFPFRALVLLPMALDRALLSSFHLGDLDGVRQWVSMAESAVVSRRGLPYVFLMHLRNLLAYGLGQYERAREGAQEALRRLASLRIPGELGMFKRLLGASLRLELALVAAAGEPSRFAEEISALERQDLRQFDTYAAIVRALYHRLRGEEERALELDAVAEATLLQLGAAPTMMLRRPVMVAICYALTRDALGLKRALEELSRLARAGGPVGDVIALTRGEYHLERGELAEARTELLRALDLSRDLPGTWQAALTALAEVHLAAGEGAEALARAREAVEAASGPEGVYPLYRFRGERTLALAEAAVGDPPAAIRRLERLQEAAARLDNPMLSGMLNEARASVALLAGDRPAWRAALVEMERCYGATRNPVLLARVHRLQEAGAVHSPAPAEVIAEAVTVADRRERPVQVALAGCRGPAERAARALELLVSAADGVSGYLYRAREGRISLIAPEGGEAPPDEVEDMVRRLVEASRRGPGAPSTQTRSTRVGPAAREGTEAADGPRWHPLSLTAGEEVVGVAIIAEGTLRYREVPAVLLREVAEAI